MKKYSLKVNSIYDEAEVVTRIVDNNMEIFERIDNKYVHEKFIVRKGCKLKLISVIDARDALGTGRVANGLIDVYHQVVLDGNGAEVTIDTRGVTSGGNKIIYRSSIETRDETLKNLKGHESMDFVMLDNISEIDAIPSISINRNNVELGHKLKISKINNIQKHYMSMHGLNNVEIDDMYVEGLLKS